MGFFKTLNACIDLAEMLTPKPEIKPPSQPPSQYQYNYDIGELAQDGHWSDNKDLNQMYFDIYGIHGSNYKSMSDKLFFEGRERIDNMSIKQLLDTSLASLHPELCWHLYHCLREKVS